MNISKNSFYVWVLKYCLGCSGQKDYPKSFCTLMWSMIFGVLLAPVLLPYVFITENMSKLLDKGFKNQEHKLRFLFLLSIVCSTHATYFLIFVNADEVKNLFIIISIFISMVFGYIFLSFMTIGAICLFVIEPIYTKYIKGSLENSFVYNIIKSYKEKTCKIINYEE